MLTGATLRRVNLAEEAERLWNQLEEAGHGPIARDIFTQYEYEALYSDRVNGFVEEENERRREKGTPELNTDTGEELRFRRRVVEDGLTTTGIAGWPSAVIRRYTDALRKEVKRRGLRSWD